MDEYAKLKDKLLVGF